MNELIKENETAGQDISSQVETENSQTGVDKEEKADVSQGKTEQPEGNSAEGTTPDTPYLSPGVTWEPRFPEEMDLNLIKGYPKAIRAYLPVSDDRGEFIDDPEIVEKVKNFYTKELDLQDTAEADLMTELKVGFGLLDEYGDKVNNVEIVSVGMATKARIIQGHLLNRLRSISEKLQIKWWPRYEDLYGNKGRRSAEDYMRLAAVPGIIRYAVFGKERLLQLARHIDLTEHQSDDPVGELLREIGVKFDLEDILNSDDIKGEVDIAITAYKLFKAEINEVPQEKVEALIDCGIILTRKHLQDLKTVKEAGGDVAQHFDKIIISKGKEKMKTIATPEEKAESFKKNFERFAKAIEAAISDRDYLGRCSVDALAALKAKIENLEREFNEANEVAA